MTIESMEREFRYDNLRLPDPNKRLSIDEVRTAFSGDISGNRHRECDRAGSRQQQARLLLYESDRHQRMSKERVLEELRRVIEGRTSKTSEIVREFKTCPQFRQCCQVLSRALQQGAFGRRSALRPPSATCSPWLIARGRSL